MSPKELAETLLAVDECPDDLPTIGSPYRSWQITEERVEALKVATGEMDLSENIFYLNSLKTMLKEVGQE